MRVRAALLFVAIFFAVVLVSTPAFASSLEWQAEGPDIGDEVLFYRADGEFRFYHLNPDGTLPGPLSGGSGYSSNWDSIISVDMDGDGQDEILFYRTDGTYRYYDIRADGTLPAPILSGSGYSQGWNSITSVDMDGDGQDEILFYRTDGTYRYYDIQPGGSLTPILTGSGYSQGWDSITGLDMDGDGQDEILFYRPDGTYRYYDIQPNGSLPLIASGTDFGIDWSLVTSMDVDGDGVDELLRYREDGSFEYSKVNSDGSLQLLNEGTGYTQGWTSIVGVNLDWHPSSVTLREPTDPYIVVSPFGLRLHPILGIYRLHGGVDLDNEFGDPVYSAAPGVVVHADVRGGFGNLIEIDHGGNMTTLYAHLSAFHVDVGDWVERGDLIGDVGSTGLSTAPHLHFETREYDIPVDPELYLPT